MLRRILLKLAGVAAALGRLSYGPTRLALEGGHIVTSAGRFKARWEVLEAVEDGGKVFVIYDYMAFPRGEPARNLFAYDLKGKELWRAGDIGAGATDAFTQFAGESPARVSNFAGYECEIDLETGKVLGTRWTK